MSHYRNRYIMDNNDVEVEVVGRDDETNVNDLVRKLMKRSQETKEREQLYSIYYQHEYFHF